MPSSPYQKSSIPLTIPTTDLHRSNLLHHHRNPVHRRHPPIPTLRSARHFATNRTDCRRRHRRQAPLVLEMYNAGGAGR